jgi:hypothetical protein
MLIPILYGHLFLFICDILLIIIIIKNKRSEK